jgi:SAM-dependent methyltransferase
LTDSSTDPRILVIPATIPPNAMMKIFSRKETPTLTFKKSFDWKWTSIRFNRVALVNLLCATKLDGNYLEIGCQGNLCFDAVPMINKIGVDPESGGTHKEYSDDFFAKNTTQFDVIFIDGLHVYEQVHRDVANAIKCLKPGGWVAIHDMLPDDAISEHVPNISKGAWFGDVWKVAFELAASPGIEFKVVKIDAGIGLLRVVDPEAVLKDMSDLLQDKRFEYLFHHIDQLPLIEWDEAYRWIRSSS